MEEIDFYAICLDEGLHFYEDIYRLNRNDFNIWVRDNLEELITIHAYNEVIPTQEILNHFTNLGYEHEFYQCHYSAKAINILDPNYLFMNGFVERNAYPYSIITHSFNVHRGNIVDFARINNPNDPIMNAQPTFPHTYYGLNIPRELVMNNREETMQEHSMTPLLYEWYQMNN